MGISHWRRGWDGCNSRRGQILEFQSELESITVYLEIVAQYFRANQIPTERRVAVLLSVIGSRTYSLLRSLLHPVVPGDKT